MKNKYIWIILGLFLILGFYLRINMLNAPPINYHNMKSNEYLAEAKLMISNPSECLIHRCVWSFWGLQSGSFGVNGSGYFEEYTQLPIIPWLTAIGWKIVGSEPIEIPRLIIVLFSLGSIFVMYFMVRRLTDDDYLALLSAGLFSIMPLGIYFGGQAILPEMPALFFSLLSIYYFLGWRMSFVSKDIFLSTLFLGISALFKETFLIIAIPLLFITPWKKLYYTKFGISFPQIGWGLLGLVPFTFLQEWYGWIVVDNTKIISESFSLSFSRIISIDFWMGILPSLKSYVADNFTYWFFFLALGGIIMAVAKYKATIGKFTIGYLVALVAYCGVLSGKLGGHSYYQMPFLPLVCIASAYFIFNFGNILEQLIKWKYVKYVPLIFIILAAPSMIAANDRVFGTVFFGQDVAGEWIAAHTSPTDRFFIYGHSQTLAACTFAERRCGQPWNETPQSMLYLETVNGPIQDVEIEFGIRYIEMDMYGYSIAQASSNWNYIQDNYKIAWIGLLNMNGQLAPQNMILEKGGKFDMSELQEKQPYLATTYKMKYGDVPFYVIEP